MIDCDGTEIVGANLHFREGPPRFPYETRNITWAPNINGTWNDNSDLDEDYALEYKIPLSRLGEYQAGESIPANIVLTDHDDNPDGRFDELQTHFKKFWWGFDGNEFYPPDQNGNPGSRREIHQSEERFIFLDDSNPIGDDRRPDDPAMRAIQFLADSQLEYTGLIRSFEGETAAHLYDMSVTLIALTDAGKKTEAQKLARTIIDLIEVNGDEGFLYDSYNAVDKTVGQGTSSGTGPNTWAGFALAFYGKTYSDRQALDASKKIAQWVINNLFALSDGGIWGGICHPFEEGFQEGLEGAPENKHSGDKIFEFKSTEQVIDTWHLFRVLGQDSLADGVESWLITDGKGWVEVDPREGRPDQQHKRFSTGVNEGCGKDLRLYLDPQSWGSIVANFIGHRDKAEGAIIAAETHMRVDAVVNGQSISGFGDSALPKDGIIWYGGTFQMIVAYVYHGSMDLTEFYLNEMMKVQNHDGSWNHSSENSGESYEGGVCGSYDSFHLAKPHTGETAWGYFAYEDVNKNKRLPYLLDVKCGDLSEDEIVNILDSVISLKIASGQVDPTDHQILQGNLNGDEVLDVLDSIIAAQHIVRLVPDLDDCGLR